MRTSTSLTSISLAFLLSSLGLLACGGSELEPADQSQTASLAQEQTQKTPAGEATRPEGGPGRRGPRGKHGFGPPRPEKLIERFDSNKNGQLEAAELPNRMQEHIGDIDTSKDGVVDKAELDTHFKARAALHQAKRAERAKASFEKKDSNHDGVLDQAELGKHWAKLAAADANGDQKLTQDELKAAFEAGKIKPHTRGERGRGWQAEPEATPGTAPSTPAL